MAIQTTLVLERLHCISERDARGNSEPYLWAVLLWIDDFTLGTPGDVASFGPGSVRKVIKGNMRAGETAEIPASSGTLRVRFDDAVFRKVILVVALWEFDETPDAACLTGFRAFAPTLREVIAERLMDLRAAEDIEDETDREEETDRIVKEIKDKVESRVKSAIRGVLTETDKIKVLIGRLNLDDVIGAAFTPFDGLNQPPSSPTATPISLTFGEADSSNRYVIEGAFHARPIFGDRCQAQAQAVGEALAVVDGIEAEIAALQKQLRGGGDVGDEPPLPKPVILDEIDRLRTEELVPAEAALRRARELLRVCRNSVITPPIGDLGDEVVIGNAIVTG